MTLTPPMLMLLLQPAWLLVVPPPSIPSTMTRVPLLTLTTLLRTVSVTESGMWKKRTDQPIGWNRIPVEADSAFHSPQSGDRLVHGWATLR